MEELLPFIKAFVVGGVICAVGQILLDKTSLTPGRILTIFIIAGVVLSGLGIYEPFREWAGAGASVPLLGFGNVLALGVKEEVQEIGLLGAVTGGFSAGSAGIGAAVFISILISLSFRSKDKN